MALASSLSVARCAVPSGRASSQSLSLRSGLVPRTQSRVPLRTSFTSSLSRATRPEPLQIRRVGLRVRAEGDPTRKVVSTALTVGNQALDTAASFLPASIPRPVAKAGVGLLGVTIALSLVQSLFNSFVTLIFLGGLGYLGFTYLSKGSGGSKGKSTASGDDPLDEARKIMDKYK